MLNSESDRVHFARRGLPPCALVPFDSRLLVHYRWIPPCVQVSIDFPTPSSDIGERLVRCPGLQDKSRLYPKVDGRGVVTRQAFLAAWIIGKVALGHLFMYARLIGQGYARGTIAGYGVFAMPYVLAFLRRCMGRIWYRAIVGCMEAIASAFR